MRLVWTRSVGTHAAIPTPLVPNQPFVRPHNTDQSASVHKHGQEIPMINVTNVSTSAMKKYGSFFMELVFDNNSSFLFR